MTALDHAFKWIDGELVAGGALVAFGLLLVGCGGLLWRFGESAAARAMVVPLLVMGGLIAALSAVGTLNNVCRIAEFREAYAVDPAAFVEQEVARVQGFMSWYVYTFVCASILIVAGATAFLIAGAPLWKSIGLALIVLGAKLHRHGPFHDRADALAHAPGGRWPGVPDRPERLDHVGAGHFADRQPADVGEGEAGQARQPVAGVALVAPAGAHLVPDALGGVGEREHALEAALLGERVASGAGKPAVGERLGAGFLKRDEREAAESEFASSAADGESLNPASGAGRLDFEVEAVAVATCRPWRRFGRRWW